MTMKKIFCPLKNISTLKTTSKSVLMEKWLKPEIHLG